MAEIEEDLSAEEFFRRLRWDPKTKQSVRCEIQLGTDIARAELRAALQGALLKHQRQMADNRAARGKDFVAEPTLGVSGRESAYRESLWD